MRRDVLLLEEMIEAAVQAVELIEGVAVEDLAADRIRRDALLWNFAVLGEAAAQLSAELKPYAGWLVKGGGGGARVRPGPPRVKGAARPCGTGRDPRVKGRRSRSRRDA